MLSDKVIDRILANEVMWTIPVELQSEIIHAVEESLNEEESEDDSES